jgi:hypothetical protein
MAVQHCSLRILHYALDILGRVAAKISGRHHHGQGPVVVLAPPPLLQCLWPWPR